MQTLTPIKRRQITVQILLLFYGLALYKWLSGLWMFQMQPSFFITRFDGLTWLWMQTGVHEWLLNNKTGWIIFDIAFYGIPLCYWYFFCRNPASPASASAKSGLNNWWLAEAIFCAIWLVVNWVYIQCYTLYPTNSIEAHIGWLLFPVLLATKRLSSFYYVLHGLRYFFLFFLMSAAIWKFRQGGAFNPNQMSGVLLYQHQTLLVSAPDSWYAAFINWLVSHRAIGYGLYLGATLWELAVGIGFFTKKYDRFIFLSFLFFLGMDYLVMRIPYFELLPLAVLLLHSRLQLAEDK